MGFELDCQSGLSVEWQSDFYKILLLFLLRIGIISCLFAQLRQIARFNIIAVASPDEAFIDLLRGGKKQVFIADDFAYGVTEGQGQFAILLVDVNDGHMRG